MDIEAERQEYLAELTSPAAGDIPPSSVEEIAEYAASEAPDEAELCRRIGSLAIDNTNFEAGVRTMLAILGNRALGPLARLAALRQLGAAEFRPTRFGDFHAEFIALLRKLAEDDNEEIRVAALDRLTLSNDSEAQRLLREGLQNARKPLVSAAKAIQLLARDDHGEGIDIFRKLAAEARGKVREEALRALVGDAKSARLFQALVADKDAPAGIREIAIANLKDTSAARLAQVARKLVLDDDDDDRLRATAVAAIAHTKAVADKVVTPRFAKAVESIGASTKSRALKASIDLFSKLHGGQ